jgi:dihydroxyacetone kinase-like protein
MGALISDAASADEASADPRGGSMTIEVLEAWLRLAAARLHAGATRLTELDQAIGDGDHGINMDRGFNAIVTKLDEARAAGAPAGRTPEGNPDAASLLRFAGKTLVSTVGGASGPLYGTAFLRAAAALGSRSALQAADAVTALEAAVAGIVTLGKATTGEKTMLDALVPALDAARSAVEAGASGHDAAVAARDAAATGAASTIPMLATKGRASYLGERSIGHQDPGATSSAMLLAALVEAIEADGR